MGLDANRLKRPAQKLRKALKKMPSSPSPEEIHDFRTNSRRMEVAIDVLSLDSRPNGRRLSKRISKLRRCAGKARDIDVLISYVSNLPDQIGENECSVRSRVRSSEPYSRQES